MRRIPLEVAARMTIWTLTILPALMIVDIVARKVARLPGRVSEARMARLVRVMAPVVLLCVSPLRRKLSFFRMIIKKSVAIPLTHGTGERLTLGVASLGLCVRLCVLPCLLSRSAT